MLAWVEWDAGAFERAARLDRPVFLDISSGWIGTRDGRVASVLSDPRVQDRLDRHYVAVRVDAELRPDIAARYGLGSPASVLILTPEGDVLTGGTRVEATHLAAMLDAVVATFGTRRAELLSAAEIQRRESASDALRPAGPGRPPDLDAPRTLPEGQVAAAALERATTGSQPRSTASLAALLAAILDAARLDRPDLLQHARGVADALVSLQRDPAGGFACASDDAGIDGRVFADANGAAVRALLHAARDLRDPDLAVRAIAALEDVVLTTYDKGEGVAHLCHPSVEVRGLLADQVEVSAALLDAHEASDRAVYRDLAEELMRSVLRTHWDGTAAALRDRVPSAAGGGAVGLLAQARFPIGTNCLAARVLARLGRGMGDAHLLGRAQDIVGAFAQVWPAAGPAGHAYVEAVLDVCPAGQ